MNAFPSTSNINLSYINNELIIENIALSFIINNIKNNTVIGQLIKILYNNEKLEMEKWKLLLNISRNKSIQLYNMLCNLENNLYYKTKNYIFINSNIKSFIDTNLKKFF